jgi:uncharacterized protein (TIGR03083 family)
MEVSEHVAALRREGKLMAASIGATGADAPVPSCPEWVVRDLVKHLGTVHRWATAFVAGAVMEGGDVDVDGLAANFPDDAGVTGWFADGHAALVQALEAASPDLQCWSFMPAPSPLAFWARRQAHETAIHRVDAELAAGMSPTACDPAFAADGIDELLTCFITRKKERSGEGTTKEFGVRCTDDESDWLVRIGPDGVTTERHGGQGDCAASGTASDVFFTLWNRQAPTGVSVDGDGEVLQEFLKATRIRWA